MIRFESVTKRFDDGPPAVDDLDLEILDGELTVLVGPSGCGKTTSLRMINRLEDLSSGRILVNDEDVMSQDRIRLRRRIGYVMQTSGLFPHRRIRANIATVPRLLGWSREQIDRRVEELAELVGLAPELLDRFPHALSGGQQQRVGVARALAADPPLMLMDEPFAAVDPIVRTHLQDELVRLQRRLGKTIVFVTHDIDEAIKLGDRIAVFQDGGRVAQYASPTELLAAPANDFVVGFLGRDRELRRLALIDVADAGVEEAPVVLRGDSAEAARETARRHGRDWVIVVDDAQRLDGWVALDALTGPTVADAVITGFRYTVSAGDSLRGAVNAMVASTIGVAPRLDSEGRLEGVLTQGEPEPGVGMNAIRWSWIGDNTDLLLEKTLEHVHLAGLAMLFGFLIAFPLALAAVHWPRMYGPSLAATGVAFTIPSLALFILLIPFTGLSVTTSLIGLTIYTLLILFRNIVAGLNGVPRDVSEAARAMGYTRLRQLFTVELPVALPVIMAGVRIAAVTTIGLVTVTALIGQGGLGQLFITGFTLHRTTPLIVGFVLSVALAVVVDLLLVALLWLITPWRRGRE